MIEKVHNSFKKLFEEKEEAEIEEPNKNVVDQQRTNKFYNDLKNSANDRARLLDIQRKIKAGNISEKDLKSKDINLLKELYCEQILELTNSIQYYTKELKKNSN